jgi:hypothetical protein
MINSCLTTLDTKNKVKEKTLEGVEMIIKPFVVLLTAIVTYQFWEKTQLLEKLSDYLNEMKKNK